jgi:cardiolipin synthase
MDRLLELAREAGPSILAAVSIAGYLASFAVVVAILRQRSEPSTMLAWILAVILLPLVGPFLYWLLGEPRMRRRKRRKRRRSAAIFQALAAHTSGGSGPLAAGGPSEIDAALRELAVVSSQVSPFPVTAGNRVGVFDNAEQIYGEIQRSIDAAEHHVHLEYYIFRADATGRVFRDQLAEKARAGVEVRVLLDGVGSWGTRRSFFAPLVRAGGRVETFHPALPLRRKWNMNYRNHRKIAVVDGKEAFTGSQNIGDEYRGRWRRVAPWKDTHLRIEGPAAVQLQEIFIEDWYYAAEENLARADYLRQQPNAGTSLVQVIPSGIDQPKQTLHEVVFLAISLARRRIRISTAYFVPDPSLVLALKSAARRGVRVDLLIPARTDNWLVLWAGRSYYGELLDSGVRIYEHPHAMLHSKIVTIDEEWSLVGSANMDVRSFSLNFEVTASIFDPAIARRLNDSFSAECRLARRVTLEEVEKRSYAVSIVEGLARLCSPLL